MSLFAVRAGIGPVNDFYGPVGSPDKEARFRTIGRLRFVSSSGSAIVITVTSPTGPSPAFCTHCGQPLPAGAGFCSRCGEPLGQLASPVVPAGRLPQVEAPAVPDRFTAASGLVAEAAARDQLRTRGISWRSLLIGLAAGALIAVGGAAWVLKPASSTSTSTDGPILMSVDVLPAEVLGRGRVDIELRDRTPKQAESFRSMATASVAMFRSAYGGDGIQMAYGVYAAKEIDLVAVNGELNLPLAQSPEVIQRLKGASPNQPFPVPGTGTTACVYSPAESIAMTGGSASDLVATILSTAPATGKLTCVRHDKGRNFSVQISGLSVSSGTPAEAAAEVATGVDIAWQELTSK